MTETRDPALPSDDTPMPEMEGMYQEALRRVREEEADGCTTADCEYLKLNADIAALIEEARRGLAWQHACGDTITTACGPTNTTTGRRIVTEPDNSASHAARIAELRPGDVVTAINERWCFIGTMPSPLFPGLQMVIWRGPDGQLSLDNLDGRQVVGDAEDVDGEERKRRLQAAIFGRGLGW